MKKEKYIILSVVILSCLMIFIDGFIKPNYIIKSIIKLVLFLIVPIIYFFGSKKEAKLKDFLSLDLKKLKLPLILGFLLYFIILGGYIVLRNVVDFESLVYSITSDISINKDNFFVVSLYISLINSFLEEFFFRGFAFLSLKEHRKFSYIFSSLMFAMYHAGTISGFSPLIFLLTMIFLFIAGLIFDYLCERNKDIYPSYALHMAANLGINTIGFTIFGLI